MHSIDTAYCYLQSMSNVLMLPCLVGHDCTSPAVMDEPIEIDEMAFGMWTWMDERTRSETRVYSSLLSQVLALETS